MSRLTDDDPIPGDKASCDAVETVIVPRTRDLGGFEVRRALPSVQKRLVGPFIFWDQIGPSELVTGQGIDVRPHPHIGLATITYLFDGAIYHRDNLGTAQSIEPGAVNWMNAGRGIVHSERSSQEWRNGPDRKLYGIQSWVALPKSAEENAPGFIHHDDSELPIISDTGKTVRLIAGEMYGEKSPLITPSDMFYADVKLETGTKIPLPAEHEERGVYVAHGKIEITGDKFEGGRLLVFHPGDEITITATKPSRLLFIGGEPMDGPRHIWWNFVSSSKERIDQAKEDWKQKRFDVVPGDEEEFIPLPE